MSEIRLTKPQKAATVRYLEKVREKVTDPESWIKHRYYDVNPQGKDCYCLDGALMVTEGDRNDLYWNGVDTLVKTIKEQTDQRITGVVEFNDYPSTRHGDVLDVLDKTIERLSA